jgi:hypothetical protein
LIVVAVVVSGVVAAAQSKTSPPPALTGKWIMTLEMSQGTATPALALEQKGEKLTGTYTGRYGSYDVQGTVKERAVTFFFTMQPDGGEAIRLTFTGEVAADAQSMKGTATMGELGEATWTAARDKKS